MGCTVYMLDVGVAKPWCCPRKSTLSCREGLSRQHLNKDVTQSEQGTGTVAKGLATLTLLLSLKGSAARSLSMPNLSGSLSVFVLDMSILGGRASVTERR
jgi:hypothetical protein